MPQWPKGGAGPLDESKLQEQIRDAIKSATEAAQENLKSRKPPKNRESIENRNEKNIDELREELAAVHEDIEEIKEILLQLKNKCS
jgi:hypothetical protein